MGTVRADRGWFAPGAQWWGDFGDPHVILDGDTYYAYSSPSSGRILPVLTSKDLRTWRIHDRWSTKGPPGSAGYNVQNDTSIPAEIRGKTNMGAGIYQDSDWGRYDNNDALVRVSSWGLTEQRGPWVKRSLWAPAVAKIGNTWFAYSAVRVSTQSDDPHGFGRFCLTVASSTSPAGPFRDVSGSGPIQCQSSYDDPAGSIDPFPFVDPIAGGQYLLWKAAGKQPLPGVKNPHPSAIYAQPLDRNGKLLSAPKVKLLETREGGWEGFTIENAAMVRYERRYYLFYSGNYSGVTDSSGSSKYATGYAICPKGPRAPCNRVTVNSPLMASTSNESGPGGATPFVDMQGKLRLAYAFFWPGEKRSGAEEYERHPRRMNIATVTVQPNGHLSVERPRWTAN